jgi:ABC-type transporter Mla subunit MlaD
MRLARLSTKALERIQKVSQWDVNEAGEAVPLGSTTAPGGSGDVSQQVQQLQEQFNQQNSVLQEWLEYLNQFNAGMSESVNEVWTDVNTIADDVNLLKEKVEPTTLPSNQKPTTPSDVFQGVMQNK